MSHNLLFFTDVCVFAALCNGVMCVLYKNKGRSIHTPTSVFGHNEIMCAFVAHNYIIYKKNGNKHKNVLKQEPLHYGY